MKGELIAVFAWLVATLIAAGGRAAADEAGAAPVRGTVVDDRTGEAIREFFVTYGDDGSIPYWQQAGARQFADGRFAYAPPAPPLFDRKEFRLRVWAKGYKGAVSRVIRRTESNVELAVRLVPRERFGGVVAGPDGRPVAGAVVRVVTPGTAVSISNGATSLDDLPLPGDERRSAKTDDAGRFDVDLDCEHCRIVVLHDAGFANVWATKSTREAGTVSLRPWGRVACEVSFAGRPVAGVRVLARPVDDQGGGYDEAYVGFDAAGETGADGRRTLGRALPGRTVVAVVERSQMGRRERYWGSRLVWETPVDVPTNGGEVAVRIGGGGVEVSGRLTAEAADVPWRYAIARLRRAFPEGQPAPRPKDWREEVLMRRSLPVDVRPDGTFRATDVPPGDWRLDGMVFVEGKRPTDLLRYSGDVLRRFGVAADAVDLGDVAANFRVRLRAGDAAPDFETVTLDGKRLRLSALRGKYVLLDFWATWCPPCRAELPFLKESWEKLKGDADVVIVGLSLDATDAPVRPFVAEHGYGWRQGVLGEKSAVAGAYGIVDIPCTWLVLPDGTLAATSVDRLPEQIATHRAATKGAAGR